MEDEKLYSGKFLFQSILVGFVIFSLPWISFLVQYYTDTNWNEYGLHPRSIVHWYGIFTMPFLHDGWDHILSNSIPLWFLTSCLYYAYYPFFRQVMFFLFIVSGLWTFIIGRTDVHVGASAVIYGLASYIFWSGVWSKHYRLATLSLLIVFLYGSIVWGLFPIRPNMSWEGHLSGFLAGLVLSLYFKKELPKRKVFEWEIKPDNSEYVKVPVEEKDPKTNQVNIHYIYVPKEKVIVLDDDIKKE